MLFIAEKTTEIPRFSINNIDCCKMKSPTSFNLNSLNLTSEEKSFQSLDEFFYYTKNIMTDDKIDSTSSCYNANNTD